MPAIKAHQGSSFFDLIPTVYKDQIMLKEKERTKISKMEIDKKPKLQHLGELMQSDMQLFANFRENNLKSPDIKHYISDAVF